MSAFTYAPKPKPNRNRTANRKRARIWFYFFSVSVAEFQQNTTGNFDKICTYTTTCVVYNLVIMKTIEGLSSETTVRLFYKHNTIDYRILWDNTQSDYNA